MALVVETTTIASASYSDNLTITKPSGVQVGDLLLIIANGYGYNGFPTVSGFSAAVNYGFDSSLDASLSILYRIADASDVSASNYTIDVGGTNTLGVAAMLRVSGWNSSINPVYTFATAGDYADPVTTIGASGLNLSRPSNSLLLIANCFVSNESDVTFGGYSITSSGSNPTWTGVQDAQVLVGTSSYHLALSVAYANDSNQSSITAFNSSVSPDSSGGGDAIASILAVICEQKNATASNALFQTSPVTFATLTSSTQNVSNQLLEISPEIPSPITKAISPTQWQNETANPTTWTNETI
jgi:hypothetical protein